MPSQGEGVSTATAGSVGPQPPGASGGPIFVIGAMGSGSTLLRLMLDSHEHIAMPQETGFLRLALSHTWVPFWEHGGEWHRRLGLTDDELVAELRGFFGGLFERYARERGKQRWGEKTPFHVWYTELARRIFPDAVFVGTVRHPGAVAVSLHERFDDWPWPRAVGHWVRETTALVQIGCDLGGRFTLLRYEDLVRNPEPTMRELLDWLGEPWSAQVLSHHEVQPRSGGPVEVEGMTRIDDPLDPRRSTRWTANVNDEVRALLRTRAAALAGFLGYDVDDAEQLGELTAVPGRHLINGADLARRRAEDRTLDWSTRPAPAWQDQQLRRPPTAWSSGAPAPEKPAPLSRRFTRRLPAPLRIRWYRLRRDHPWIDPRRR